MCIWFLCVVLYRIGISVWIGMGLFYISCLEIKIVRDIFLVCDINIVIDDVIIKDSING